MPDADGPAALWRLLREGRDAVREIPASRWRVDDVYHPDPSEAGTISTRFGSFLGAVDGVDWRTLRIAPREARFMDPQQRLLLELAWEALEDAGLPFERVAGTRTSVHVGIKWNDYAKLQALRPEGIDSYTVNGSDLSLAANRISYQFDLVGPSIALDVGCASSLVAVHLACSGILSGEAECAIAGGVNLMLALDSFICATKANLLAPDGRCKMFDASADGYGRAEGGGLVVLKSLDRALDDGDRIWGVIRGSAVVHNGRTEWIMASSPEAQARLMHEALRGSGVDPGQVGYVELHGTGTRKGDPIEARAVGAVYGGAVRSEPLLVGSIKTNLGHAEAAAGIAGLAKVLVSLDAGEIPRNLHFDTVNPDIPLDELGLRVVTETTPWAGPRVAAINSLSLGGGNAHLLVEGAPPRAPAPGSAAEGAPTLLLVSARSAAGLRAQAERFARFLASERPPLADVAWTAAVRRTHHEHRIAVTGTAIADVVRRLEAFAAGGSAEGVAHGSPSGEPRPVFVFSGQGTTWPGMARALIASEPVFRDALADCERLLREHVEWSLGEELERGEERWRLNRTELAQPAIYAIQVALAALWRSWGVEPVAVVGHSVGEIAAAQVAGALGARDAARIACERGRLMERAAGLGRMLQVDAPAGELRAHLAAAGGRVEIAAHNGPTETVLSGEPRAIDALAEQLRGAGLTARALPVDHAFHSRQLDPFVEPLVARLGAITARPPVVPLHSTLTGARAGDGDLGARYWGRQMREPVRFAEVMDLLVGEGHETFLEIGPAAVLGGCIREALRARGRVGVVAASGRRGRDDRASLFGSAGLLHVHGVRLRLEAMLGPSRPPVSLPGYPWQRERLWFDSSPDGARAAVAPAASRGPLHPLLGRHTALASPAGAHVWDAAIDPAEIPWSEQHTVDGVPVIPASAYVEIVAAAVDQAFGWKRCRLFEVELVRALSVRGPTGLQLALSPLGGGVFGFDVFAREAGAAADAPWLRRASGRVEHLAEAPAEPIDVAAARARLPEELDHAACYAELATSGDGFGPAFQGIAAAWRAGGEVLTRIAPPAPIAAELGRYRFHPALLDAAMHALPLVARRRGERGCMPTRIEEVRVYSSEATPLWSRVRLLDRPAGASSGVDRADIEVFAADGAPLLVVRDLLLQWLDASPADERAGRRWCYRIEHRELAAAPPRPEPATWVVIEDSAGIGRALVRKLEARGHRAALVGAEAPARGAGGAGPRHVVHLGALDAGPFDPTAPAELGSILESACGSVLALANQLAAEEEPGAVLWLVTRGARSVTGPGEPVSPVQAAIWGLGRTAAQEIPSVWGGLVDLDPDDSADDAAAHLARALCEPSPGEDVAIRAGRRYAARLVREPLTAGPPVAIRGDGAYLVTGGFGGLGHAAAGWLVGQGARTIILMGRTAPPPRAAWGALDPRSREAALVAQVRELEAAGAAVHVAAVDVSRRDALAAWLREHRARDGAPIRGVLHCAGVVALEPLAQTTDASLRQVLAAKALGAAWLHALLADEPLDLFVLYSSAAAVLDSPMLGAYAAANAFLDGLAHHRAKHGLPAITVNWGPWSEVGLVTRTGGRGPSAGNGVTLIEPAAGLELLERILAADIRQVAVLPIDWPAWRAAHPAASAAPLLSELVPAPAAAPAASAAASASAPAASAALSALPPDRLAAAARDLVRAEVARALFLDGPDAVELDRPLTELGFDSLMATELSNALGRRLGLALPPTLALDHPTPGQIADHLVTRLDAAPPGGGAGGSPGPARPQPAAGRRDDLLGVVCAEVARALFLDGPDAVELDRPLTELGFDSLMATELAAALGKVVGLKLPAALALDHPTPRGIADYLAARLTPSAPAEAAADRPAPPPLAPPAPAAEEARLGQLSAGQERLHFLDRLRPPSSQYVEFFAIQVSEPLDVDRLRRALALLVRRHETLRTTFPDVAVYPDPSPSPRALIAPDGPVPLEVADLRGDGDPEASAARIAADVLGRPFELARGPLWRVLLLSLEDRRHTLWFAKHHIITDAISIGTFADELARLYRSGADPAALPAPRFQYSDHCQRERRRSREPAHDESVAWWRGYLAGAQPLELPRSAAASGGPEPGDQPADSVVVSLPPALTRAVKELGRREGCTAFEILLAAWAGVLQRYSGQSDVVVGTMVAENRGELDGVLGFFVNTVALRCDLSGSPSFPALARRVARDVRQALQHREVDFGDVVRALRDERGQGASPLVQATLNLVPPFPPLGGPGMDGWAWADGSWMPVQRPAKFELSLELVDGPGGMAGKLEYATELFDRSLAEAIARHFQALLAAGVGGGDAPVDELPILSEPERRRMLVEWNDTAAPFPDRCLHELFAEQVARAPDAVAVSFEDRRLTYAELDARANQLAHHLASLGVGPEVTVAVCMARSERMVIALLGVLKAGGAYVALDPAHPSERIAFMLEDSAPAVLVTDAATGPGLPPHPARRVCVDGDAAAIAARPAAAPAVEVRPDGLAYVIYTSGSTGRPKAVLGLHRGAASFLAWLAREVPFDPGEVCALKTSLSFVDAYVEIFGPLLRGVPLVVVPERLEKDAERLIDLLSRQRVTRLVLVPSLLAAMLEVGGDLGRRLGRLRYWLLSGERLPDELCERLRDRLPDAVVLNTYGSSEVSANVTWHRCEPGVPVSIGRPLANTRVHVLDARRRPVPVGVAGELHVGGVGLARGYLGLPAMTAERFVPDPFGSGAVLYRMGDRVRWLPDGTLEYLGRVDHQVKLRGHRIELGEVEAALSAHPAVRAAVVSIREDSPGEPRLVAHVVPVEEPGPSASELRAHLGRHLPDAMVPSAFALLDAMPLTASGKVDRRALAAAGVLRLAAPSAEPAAPRGALAEALADVWREVLNVAEVDARLTFFQQGGDSLRLVRVQQRLREALGVELSVAELFGYPTIEALAGRIGASQAPAPARRRAAAPAARPAAAMSVEDLERLIDEKYLERSSDGSGG